MNKPNRYVIRWRMVRGTERPVIVVNDDRYVTGHVTKRAAIEAALKRQRKALERDMASIVMQQQYIADLEALAAKERKGMDEQQPAARGE